MLCMVLAVVFIVLVVIPLLLCWDEIFPDERDPRRGGTP